jgi:hypothetical protein
MGKAYIDLSDNATFACGFPRDLFVWARAVA